MISIKKIIFWEPSVSPHKMSLISSIADQHNEVDVFCCAQIDVSEDRLKQGWKKVSCNNCQILITPSESEILDLTLSDINTTVHIFAGIRYVPIICSAIKNVIKNKGLYYVMSEPRSFEGFKGYIRFVESWLFERKIRKSTRGVFAIGANGKNWFKRVGYSESKIFDFAYYLDYKNEKILDYNHTKEYRLLYIGKLTKIKGVEYLIDAVNKLGKNYPLKVIGDGEQRNELELLSKPHIKYEGVVPMQDISKKLAFSDILILPSISDVDGWGAVVSEALLQGCAVIVTNKVGASSVVINDAIGRIIPARDSVAIANAINSISEKESSDVNFRDYRKTFAINNLTGSVGAKYLWDVIQCTLNDPSQKYSFINLSELYSDNQ